MGATRQILNALKVWRIWIRLGILDIHRAHVRAYIGPFWIMLQAAAWIGLIAIVFRPLHIDKHPAYLSYVAIGVMVYNVTAHVIGGSADAFVRHRNIIWNMPVPFLIFPLKTVVSGFYVGLLQLPIIISVLVLDGHVQFGQMWLLIPAFFILLVCLAGVSLFFAFLGAFSGDFRFMIQIGMRFLFFATPIFWLIPTEPSLRRVLALANPMTHFMEVARVALLGGPMPYLSLGVIAGCAAAACLLAFICLATLRNKVIKVL